MESGTGPKVLGLAVTCVYFAGILNSGGSVVTKALESRLRAKFRVTQGDDGVVAVEVVAVKLELGELVVELSDSRLTWIYDLIKSLFSYRIRGATEYGVEEGIRFAFYLLNDTLRYYPNEVEIYPNVWWNTTLMEVGINSDGFFGVGLDGSARTQGIDSPTSSCPYATSDLTTPLFVNSLKSADESSGLISLQAHQSSLNCLLLALHQIKFFDRLVDFNSSRRNDTAPHASTPIGFLFSEEGVSRHFARQLNSPVFGSAGVGESSAVLLPLLYTETKLVTPPTVSFRQSNQISLDVKDLYVTVGAVSPHPELAVKEWNATVLVDFSASCGVTISNVSSVHLLPHATSLHTQTVCGDGTFAFAAVSDLLATSIFTSTRGFMRLWSERTVTSASTPDKVAPPTDGKPDYDQFIWDILSHVGFSTVDVEVRDGIMAWSVNIFLTDF